MRKLVFVATLALASIGFAQTGRPAIDYLSLKQECGLMLAIPSYRTAIKATTYQEARWKSIFKEYDEARAAAQANNHGDSDAVNDATLQKLETLDKSAADRSISIATDTQRKLIEEFALRELGVEAFTKDDFLDELECMTAQKQRIAEIMREYQDKAEDQRDALDRREGDVPDPKPGDDASLKKYREAIAKILQQIKGTEEDPAVLREDTEKKIADVLTSEQFARYQKMLRNSRSR